MFESCDVVECLRHFDGILPSFGCILMKKHGVRGGKYLLKTPGKTISETLNFKMFPRCPGPQELVPLVQVSKLPTTHYQPAS